MLHKAYMDEQELIQGCIRSDRLCQAKLFKRYSGRMKAICLRYVHSTAEAEDVMLEGFLKLFEKIHEYNFEGTFESWMKTIIVNTALTRFRDRDFKIEIGKFEEYDDSARYDESYKKIIDGIAAKEIREMIAALPDGYRIIFNLFVVDGYTHDEIAARFNISVGTSRSQLYKARKILQEKLHKSEIIIAHAS